MPEKFYFTFAFSDAANRKKYIVFEGSMEETRARMFERFGDQWAFQYTEKEFEGQAERFGLTEMK